MVYLVYKVNTVKSRRENRLKKWKPKEGKRMKRRGRIGGYVNRQGVGEKGDRRRLNDKKTKNQKKRILDSSGG